ncbi:uncharacterized protein LOC141703299 [Apium graveolens]|uniref:uncharacterized protein LOC141703299 n=1 Tax=Apium graveolens TaxID=4045 RepID=UPI003D79DF38
MPREAASGRNGDGLAVGRESVPARFQLTNDRGMTQLAPSHSLSLQTPHQHGMPRYKVAANNLHMSGRGESGININALVVGRNFPSPAEGHRREMNLGGTIQAALIPLALKTPNPLVMVPNNLTGDRFNWSGVYGHTNIGGVMQHTLPSSSSMQPTAPFSNPIQAPYPDQAPPMVPQWSSVHQPASGGNINDLAYSGIISSPAATTQGQLTNYQVGNGLDMTGRFYGQTKIVRIMQYTWPSP